MTGSALRITFALIVTLRVFLPTTAFTSSDCRQEFHIYGKTPGDTSILYISEVLPGCEAGTVWAFHVLHDTAFLFNYSRSGGYPDTSWVADFLKSMGEEPSIVPADSSGCLQLNPSIRICLPPLDPDFDSQFSTMMDHSDARASDWRREFRPERIDEPIFSGASVDRLSRHPKGIYKNYTFSQAAWFPESSLLVLVIYQPKRAAGLDTNHGILIYRVSDMRDDTLK